MLNGWQTFDTLKPYLKPSANIFINVGDTFLPALALGVNILMIKEMLLRHRKTVKKLFHHKTASA